MGPLDKIITIILILCAMFLLYQTIKHKPKTFSTKNLNKSFTTMGILGLILIAFVGLTVILLKN